MTVFAVNMTSDDTTNALQWGDIRHINLKYVYSDEIENQHLPASVEEALQRAVEDFDPVNDFMLALGDYVQMLAFARMLGVRHGKFRVLRWDKKASGYVPCWV